MFEKDAEERGNEKIKGNNDLARCSRKNYKDGFKEGAEFGYNKANEWHYVSEVGIPQTEGHYFVCLRNKDHDITGAWINYDKDVGWYSLDVRIKDIYAWKEIVLPELPKESEFKSDILPEITLPKGSAEFIDKAITDAEKRLKESE